MKSCPFLKRANLLTKTAIPLSKSDQLFESLLGCPGLLDVYFRKSSILDWNHFLWGETAILTIIHTPLPNIYLPLVFFFFSLVVFLLFYGIHSLLGDKPFTLFDFKTLLTLKGGGPILELNHSLYNWTLRSWTTTYKSVLHFLFHLKPLYNT